MNFGFSGEMIFLFLLALILFGPKKMPEIGRQVARSLGEFRRASNEFRAQIESEVNSLDMSGKDMGKPGSGNPRQQMLPSFKEPLGALANRILNPPTAAKPTPAGNAAAEVAAAPAGAPEPSSAPGAVVPSVVPGVVVPSADAPKVAPDA